MVITTEIDARDVLIRGLAKLWVMEHQDVLDEYGGSWARNPGVISDRFFVLIEAGDWPAALEEIEGVLPEW